MHIQDLQFWKLQQRAETKAFVTLHKDDKFILSDYVASLSMPCVFMVSHFFVFFSPN